MTLPVGERPKLARRARLTWDAREAKWILLWPERGLLLNDSAGAIVRLCDGSRTVGGIVDQLASEWSAPRAQIEPEVHTFLEKVARRGLFDAGE